MLKLHDKVKVLFMLYPIQLKSLQQQETYINEKNTCHRLRMA